MDARETIAGLLSELSARVGADLRLDEDGACAIRYGESGDLVIEAVDELLMLHAALHEVPQTGREAFYERVLSLALHGIATGGCVLGLDRAGDRIVLTRSWPAADLDRTGFENLLTGFIETAERLRPRLAPKPEEAPVSLEKPPEAWDAGDLLRNLGNRV